MIHNYFPAKKYSPWHWFSFWRRQILSTRQNMRRISFKNKQNFKKSESSDFFSRENVSKLQSLYISEEEFSEEDRRSMLECFSRNFPKYSKEILKKILESSNHHLYIAVNNLLHWRAKGHPQVLKGMYQLFDIIRQIHFYALCK